MYYRGKIHRRLDYRYDTLRARRGFRVRHLLALGALLVGIGVALGLTPYRAGAMDPVVSGAIPVAGVAAPTVVQPLELPGIDAPPLPHRSGPAAGSSAPAPAEHIPAENIKVAGLAIPEPVLDSVVAATVTEPPADDLHEQHPWTALTVKAGDNLALIFQRQGASAGDLHRIISLGEKTDHLTRLQPGREVRLRLDEGGGVLGLRYEIDAVRTLGVDRDETGFTARMESLAVEGRPAFSTAIIEDSLYLTAKRNGLSDALIMELANIFGWDVDFALDVRAGDRFSVMWEEQYAHGTKVGDGPILAAQFVNQGRVVEAVRYSDPEGRHAYFAPDGLSMRKAFLRSPVDFRRISSRFQRERWHPVLGKKRPHRGVDYAAATGTPVKAAGDGKVVHRGRKGGYGKTIVIQHGSQYTTLYAHLSSYKRGVTHGKKVKQGQVIGFVGSTGLATGPHLHYEFRVNGVHRNPLTVKLPAADPVPEQYRDHFFEQTRPLLAQLEQHLDTRLALAETE